MACGQNLSARQGGGRRGGKEGFFQKKPAGDSGHGGLVGKEENGRKTAMGTLSWGRRERARTEAGLDGVHGRATM